MIDPDLERRLSDCRSLLQLWTRFQEFFDMSVKGQALNAENEKKFLELKSRVAMLHDSFMDSIEENSAPIAQGMLDNVIRAITLKHISRLNAADVKKMQIEWHESYLLLNEVIGLLEEEQAGKAKISKSSWQLKKFGKGMSKGGGNIFHNIYLRMTIVIGAVLFALIGLPLMGVFTYWAILDFAPTQPMAYWVLETMIRPYVDVPWRTVDEAMIHGRAGAPNEKFTDYVPAGVLPEALSTYSKIEEWANKKAKMNLSSVGYSGLEKLKTPKAYSLECWKFGGTQTLIAMHFLLGSSAEAKQAVDSFKNWVSGLPGGAMNAFGSITAVTDHNLVILIDSANSGARDAFINQLWEPLKIAE
jgi:hypothetical protein